MATRDHGRISYDAERVERAYWHLENNDDVFAKHLRTWIRMEWRFEYGGFPLNELVRYIAYQNSSISTAQAIVSDLHQKIGIGASSPLSPSQLLSLTDDEYRSCGLMERKISYVRDLATSVQSGQLPVGRLSDMSDDEVWQMLTKMRGIGPSTAGEFMRFCLGRLDVYQPVSAMRHGLTHHYGVDPEVDRASFAALLEKWKPYRGVANFFMWRVGTKDRSAR